MTLGQAHKRLTGTTAWDDVVGFVQVYEAMLRTNCWTEERLDS